jgi:hypothetical protein
LPTEFWPVMAAPPRGSISLMLAEGVKPLVRVFTMIMRRRREGTLSVSPLTIVYFDLAAHF